MARGSPFEFDHAEEALECGWGPEHDTAMLARWCEGVIRVQQAAATCDEFYLVP